MISGSPQRTGYLYLPAAALVGLVAAIPTLALLYFIFQPIDATSLGLGWNGFTFANLRVLLERRTMQAEVRTCEFAAVATIVEIAMGTAIGLVFSVDKRVGLRGARFLAAPIMISPLAVGMLWKLLFTQQSGWINLVLAAMGCVKVQWLSLAAPNVAIGGLHIFEWLNLCWGFFVLILADVWQWTPLVAIVVIARLHSVPQSLTEAARIDGLREIEIARAILLPLLRPTLTLVAALRVIDTFRVFENAWTLFGDSDAAASMTTVIARETLLIRNYGRGATVSIALILLALIFVAMVIKIGRREWLSE